jgi:hypothetical protein
MKCCRCGSTKKLVKHNKNKDGSIIYYWCGKCNAENMKKYRATVKGKLLLKQMVKKYEIDNPDKRRAWSKASYLPSQLPCEVCGELPTQKHHMDYNKPIEVVYLCAYHHKQVHNENN